MEFDPFLGKILGILRRGFAVDRAVVDLAVVHLARLFGKFLADVVGVLGQVLTQLPELLAKLALLRRYHGDRRLVRLAHRGGRVTCWRWSRRRWRHTAAPARAGEPRTHDRL